MRRYEEVQGGRLVQVICNRCQKELKVENGYLKEGCFHGNATFGYFSEKDGIRHRFDLCEKCYDKMVKQFAIPVSEMPENELL